MSKRLINIFLSVIFLISLLNTITYAEEYYPLKYIAETNGYEYFYSSDYQHVPMLFFGEVIPKQWQGKQINCVCSHVDIAYSLLAQLNISNKDFQWGKNIFNPYASQYAFFEAASGFGWIRPNAEYIDYYKNDNHITYGIGDSCFFDTLKIEGQAYLQTLYKTYCDY